MRRLWSRLISIADEINHRTFARRRVTNRLCDYNERLITEDHGTDFYEDDEPIEDIRAAMASGEHGLTGPVITGTVWSSPPGMITSVSPSTLTISTAPPDA